MLYTFAFVCHIVGAVVLFLCLIVMGIGMAGTAQAASITRMQRWYRFTYFTSKILPLGAVLLLLSGLGLNLLRWGWQFGWTNVALASLLLVALVAPLVLNRRLEAIGGSLSEAQAVKTLHFCTRHPLLWWAWGVLSIVSLGIIYLMFAKPTLPTSIAVMVIAVVITSVVVLPFSRGWTNRADLQN